MYDQLEKFDQSVIDMIERLRSIIIAEFSTNGEDDSVKQYQDDVDAAQEMIDLLYKTWR